MASIKNLDDPLLVLILNRLSIQKLFTAGHVCVKWNSIRDISAHDRQELVLMIGNDAQNILDRSVTESPLRAVLVDENDEKLFPEIDPNVQLKVKSFPMDCARFLGDRFVKLTDLTLSVEFDAYQDSVQYLLGKFSIFPRSKLQSLKLFIGPNLNKKEPDRRAIRNLSKLIQDVNSIETLRKLTLEIHTYGKFPHRLHLPILAHLEEFEFYTHDIGYITGLCKSILRYAVNNQKLRKFGINTDDLDNDIDSIEWHLKLPPEFASRFTHLKCSFDHFSNSGPQFVRICEHFNKLITLSQEGTCNLNFNRLPLMNNLLFLELDYNLPLQLSFLMENGQFPVVPSVKMLTFKLHYIQNCVHRFLRQFRLTPYFPAVQVVQVNVQYSRCYECHSKRKSKVHCARHIFRHFTQYPQLRMVCVKIENIDERKETIIRKFRMDELNDLSDSDDEMGSDSDAESNPYLKESSESEYESSESEYEDSESDEDIVLDEDEQDEEEDEVVENEDDE